MKRTNDMENGSAERRTGAAAVQWGLAAAVLGAGLIATAAGSWQVWRWETRRAAGRFLAAAERQYERVLGEVQLAVDVLDSLRQVPQLSGETALFEAVEKKGMVYQRRVLGAYGFAQSLPAIYRIHLAAKGREFTEAGPDGEFVPVGDRDFYCPLTWQTPPGGLGVPLDYDFAARDAERRAMAVAARDGVFALGGAAFGAEEGTRYLLAPVYLSGPANLPQEPEGFAIALFQPDAIARRAEETGMGESRISLQPWDGSDAPDDDDSRMVRRFAVANEEWIFSATPSGTAGRSGAVIRASAVAAAGLAATVLLSTAIAGAARRSRRVERLVTERTRELAEANRRLRDVMAERLRLEERTLRLADREKARLGRDLHDSLGQKLTGALYLLAAYRRMAEEGIPSLEEDGEVISSTLKESLGQVRRMAKGLAPVELTAEGLPDALRALAAESSRLLGIAVEAANGNGSWVAPAEGVASQLYLIAQEAIVNAAKHSGGTLVRVELSRAPDGCGRLTVDDDGHGLPSPASAPEETPPPTADEGGNGMGIMRHRAEVFGGEVRIESSPLGGVRVVCDYPGPR